MAASRSSIAEEWLLAAPRWWLVPRWLPPPSPLAVSVANGLSASGYCDAGAGAFIRLAGGGGKLAEAAWLRMVSSCC